MNRTEQLREAARERWGHKWTIVRSEYEDGTVVPRARRYLGTRNNDDYDDDVLVREELLFDADDEITAYRIEYRREERISREQVD